MSLVNAKARRVGRMVRARGAFWIAFALCLLCLGGAIVNPVVGTVLAFAFAIAAWGMWHREAGAAAWAGLLLGLSPLLTLTGVISDGAGLKRVPAGLWEAIAIQVILAVFFILAARRFLAQPGGRRYLFVWVAAMAVYALFSVKTMPYVSPAAGMADTILAGEQMVCVKTHDPAPGRIVVFRFPVDPKQVFIKRVVGVPGDRIRIVHKELYRNGQPTVEPYVTHKMPYEDPFRDNFPSTPNVTIYPAGREMLNLNVRGDELVVPEGKYFVLGDNRDESLDSRYWGFIAKEDVIAKPLWIYGSYGSVLSDTAKPQTASIFTTRWGRLFVRPR